MKLLQKRWAAAVLMVLAILAGAALGQRNKPGDTSLMGEFAYVLHNEGGAISEKTVRYIEDMNASLFAQTGAQIVIDVVKTTGSQDITDYAEDVFDHYGIGSQERDNGILVVLALENMYNGAPDGDYCMSWGAGFSSSQQDRLEDILVNCMEEDFIFRKYDAAVQSTFGALVSYLEDVYRVTVQVGYLPPAETSYHAISGGYGSIAPSGAVMMEVFVGEIVTLLVILLVLWVILDAFRYRRYRRRYLGPGMGIPPVRYYPVFWGRRPRAPRPPRPPRPPQPPRPGGSCGGGSGPRPGGGLFGGGARRGGSSSSPRPGGGSFGGGARRPSSGGVKRSGGGGMHRSGGSRGGARRR